MPDHVHMMISIPPKYAVSQVVGFVKGKSAELVQAFIFLFLVPTACARAAREARARTSHRRWCCHMEGDRKSGWLSCLLPENLDDLVGARGKGVRTPQHRASPHRLRLDLRIAVGRKAGDKGHSGSARKRSENRASYCDVDRRDVANGYRGGSLPSRVRAAAEIDVAAGIHFRRGGPQRDLEQRLLAVDGKDRAYRHREPRLPGNVRDLRSGKSVAGDRRASREGRRRSNGMTRSGRTRMAEACSELIGAGGANPAEQEARSVSGTCGPLCAAGHRDDTLRDVRVQVEQGEYQYRTVRNCEGFQTPAAGRLQTFPHGRRPASENLHNRRTPSVHSWFRRRCGISRAISSADWWRAGPLEDYVALLTPQKRGSGACAIPLTFLRQA
jgi:Transposase IS200 like